MYSFKLAPHFAGASTLVNVNHLLDLDVVRNEHFGICVVEFPVLCSHGVGLRIGTVDPSFSVVLNAAHPQHKCHPNAPGKPVCIIQEVWRASNCRVLVCTDSVNASFRTGHIPLFFWATPAPESSIEP